MSWKSFEGSERRGNSIYYDMYEPYRSGYSRSLFLELANPSIEEGFRTCAKRGATEIIAIPVFLLAAGHVKNDIPFELEKLNNQYPNIKVTYGNPFGVSETLIKSVYNGSGIEEYKDEVTLLLVARGSSDPETLQDINRIATLFQAEEKIAKVEVCF